MDHSKRPHVAILDVALEISYILDNGEVSGVCLNDETLKKFGLDSQFLLGVSGNDLEDCINKLKEKIRQFNEHDE